MTRRQSTSQIENKSGLKEQGILKPREVRGMRRGSVYGSRQEGPCTSEMVNRVVMQSIGVCVRQPLRYRINFLNDADPDHESVGLFLLFP